MAQILLHGNLHATILEAHLITSGVAPGFLKQLVEGIENAFDIAKEPNKVYATIDLDKARVGRTRRISNEPENPRWHEAFQIYCAHSAANVIFTVKFDLAVDASLFGRAYLPVGEIINGAEVERWLEICDEEHNPIGNSKIHVKLQYVDVSKDRSWGRGIQSPTFPGVPYTFFQQRQGCKVSLYQDAHVPDNFIPKIPLADGKCYEPQRCWEGIFDAITNAQHLIYIAGWSVYTEITLIRDLKRPRPGGDATLGELLKKKASEGVRVLMLVWNDKTSGGVFGKEGHMETHDEDTGDYFRGTDVHCVLCERNADRGDIVENLEISFIFTHHQKIVVVDHEMPKKTSQRRRIVSFVGGIDLCDGRYDTQFHSLFRTLDTAHHDDFHQINFAGASIKKGGPREPWHDIHSKLEGPVAWDVLFNFEQRWRKQGGGEDLLVNIRDLENIIIPPSPVLFPEDRETWNVQLFRSIDAGAAYGFPETPEGAAKAGLISGKDKIVDRSIQDAYINAIRRAKNFIYIENQYFLGSSFGWKADGIEPEEIGALHLIPKELSLKIVSKIEAGELFTVYVVVPMWSEGEPESGSTQAILDWQRRTMEMMYTDIIEALKAKNITTNPKDYLSFFCLGNREVKKTGEYTPEEQPEPDTNYIRAQHARRFMIYVHAKLMIVDDEYIITGSANINQRSMDGARDSEIAMGAYQPYHLSTKQPARGHIHGFRMALWYEHLGMLDDVFLHPESLDCVHKVNAIVQKYWDIYTSDTVEHDLPGHLLSYPVAVTDEGAITELPNMEYFPDTKGRVLGTQSDFLPPSLQHNCYFPPFIIRGINCMLYSLI